VKDAKKDESFTKDNLRSIGPGFGLSPKYLEKVLTSKAVCDIVHGTAITFDLIL